MGCPQSAPAPFTCPALEDSIQATAALLPRGRAWPVNDGGGTISRFLAWLAGLGTPPAQPSSWPAGYVQAGFIAALGTVRNWAESRFCSLLDEFFCATASETLDLWNLEYGLPDPCDPFADLCTRVGAIQIAQCQDVVALAARAGWAISCETIEAFCGTPLGARGLSLTGLITCGAEIAINITITIFLAESPSYLGGVEAPQPILGVLLCGMPLNCPPGTGAIECILGRVLPAHVPVTFVTA